MNPATANPIIRHAAWNVSANPIFRRYCQSRLRARGLGVWLLLTLLAAGFPVAVTAAVAVRGGLSAADSARVALLFLLPLQGFILFILGTAQAAGGMTAERDEGVIDYQRLIPMSPLAKVIGYLFGLPVREYVLFFATLPFTGWCLWRGEVEWRVWLPLYTVLFSSTLLYHLTGLVTGTVVRNRRWAFLASIGLVFALYTVVPQVARFGLVYFKYLTITPVVAEMAPGLLPQDVGAVLAAGQRLAPTAKFFGLDFSELVFTLFSQGGLVLTFLVMLCRRWRRHEAHLLGKVWALGFFIWLQLIFLGNALPLIESGTLFPSREFTRRAVWRLDIWRPTELEAVIMCGIFGLVTLLLLKLLGSIITPTPDRQREGWRRARKLGQRRVPWLADAGTGWWFNLAMALAGGAGWFVFCRGVMESRWFPGQQVPLAVLGYFTAVLFGAGVGAQAWLESRGSALARLADILVGVVPLMVGTVLCVLGQALQPLGIWVLGISPLAQPFFAVGKVWPLDVLPVSITQVVPQAFNFWMVMWVLLAAWLAFDLRARRKAMAAAALAPPQGGVGETGGDRRSTQ